MAGYIRGITIQIDGETKGLDAEGLDETNADYRRVQREIQETETKLKYEHSEAESR